MSIHRLTFFSSLVLVGVACSSDPESDPMGSGGKAAAGGNSAQGGSSTAQGGSTTAPKGGASSSGGVTGSSSGGATSTGGSESTSGGSETAGTTSMGGSVSMGGSLALGGSTSMGGSDAGAGGAPESDGGAGIDLGGAGGGDDVPSSSGGTTSTGGTTASGGTTSSGGTTDMGGAPAEAGADGGPTATIRYDFEAGVEGFHPDTNPGDFVDSVTRSTEQAQHGVGSLKVSFDGTASSSENDPYGAARVLNPALHGNETITFHVWFDAAHAPNGFGIYAHAGESWTWTNIAYVNASSLTPNAWNAVSGVVPVKDVYKSVVLKVDTGSVRTFTGDIYIDSVSW